MELPAMPSAGTIGVTTVPLADIEDVEETPSREGPSSIQSMYQPAWENINEDTLLNSPFLRAEWVTRALAPAELVAYKRAETFNICDIANRASILVKGYICE